MSLCGYGLIDNRSGSIPAVSQSKQKCELKRSFNMFVNRTDFNWIRTVSAVPVYILDEATTKSKYRLVLQCMNCLCQNIHWFCIVQI